MPAAGFFLIGVLVTMLISLIVYNILKAKEGPKDISPQERLELAKLRSDYDAEVQRLVAAHSVDVGKLKEQYETSLRGLQQELENARIKIEEFKKVRSDELANSDDPYVELDKRSGSGS